MNKEFDIITKLAKSLPRSPSQMNELFESDSEIIRYNDKNLLFTVDDYSAEDQIRDHDPYTLGWNLTAATLSDIFASGGIPLFYAHSLSIEPDKWDDRYIKEFSEGVSAVLKKAEAFFIGGDLGTSEKWHYTGIALGEAHEPITRKGAKEGDLILMSGQIGTGNLEAAFSLYSDKPLLKPILKNVKNRFPVRLEESKLISKYATSCIDSSDGVLNALNTLADINNTGYTITETPYLAGGLAACKILSKPSELLLLGECGEYELVFTMDEKDKSKFLQTAKDQRLSFTIIGKMIAEPVKTLFSSGKHFDLTEFNIRARDYEDVKVYLQSLTHYLKSHEKSDYVRTGNSHIR